LLRRDRALLDRWVAAWQDLVEFEIHPVITTADAAARAPTGKSSPTPDVGT